MREIDLITNRILKQLMAADEPATPRRASSTEAEEPGVDHVTRPVLMERAAHLRQMARFGEGSASEVLKGYARHNIQLSVRLRSGIAELHEQFADLFIVLDGRAALVTGGRIESPKITAPGEIRGSEVVGGNKRELRPGDIAHIPAGTPHQILLSGDATFAAIVVKIRETGEDEPSC